MFASFGFPESRPVIIGILVVFELIFTPYNMVRRERERERERGRRERERGEGEGEGGRERRERERVLCFMIFCSPGNRKIKIAARWLYLVYHGL